MTTALLDKLESAISHGRPRDALKVLAALRDAWSDRGETPPTDPVTVRLRVQPRVDMEFTCPIPPKAGDPIVVVLASRAPTKAVLDDAVAVCRKAHAGLVAESTNWR